MIKLNKDTLNEFIELDRQRGVLFWKRREPKHFKRYADYLTWNAKNALRQIGTPKGNGYLVFRLRGTSLHVHRVVFCLTFGEDPYPYEIDHINGNRSDNTPGNLRLATRQTNSENRAALHSRNTSGFRGVSWHKGGQKWAAVVRSRYKSIYLGLFDNVEEAAAIAKQAREVFHGKTSG